MGISLNNNDEISVMKTSEQLCKSNIKQKDGCAMLRNKKKLSQSVLKVRIIPIKFLILYYLQQVIYLFIYNQEYPTIT